MLIYVYIHTYVSIFYSTCFGNLLICLNNLSKAKNSLESETFRKKNPTIQKKLNLSAEIKILILKKIDMKVKARQ